MHDTFFQHVKKENDIRYQIMMTFVEAYKTNGLMTLQAYVEGINEWMHEGQPQGKISIERVVHGYVTLGSGTELKENCFKLITSLDDINDIKEIIQEAEEDTIEKRDAFIASAIDYDPEEYVEGADNEDEDPLMEAALRTIYLENFQELKARLEISAVVKKDSPSLN
jgi:hypothetical protein